MKTRVLVSYFLFLTLSFCGGGKDSAQTTPAEGAEVNSGDGLIPTGKLAITGELANGEDTENTAALKEKNVEIVRNDGVVVGEGVTDQDGKFALEMVPGALVIDTSYSLLAEAEEVPTTDEFSYNIEVKIPDDGTGKALGIRKKINLSETEVKDGELALGVQNVKEISAIVGKVKFAQAAMSVSSVDVFIPGKPYFLRTGDDGAFNLLFVPAGKYAIRLTKGIYIKDIEVEVEAGKTLSLGDATIGENDRNPLPLEQVIIGKWTSTCYFSDMSHSPENPTEGVLDIVSLTNISVTGDSCLLRTFAAAPETFEKLGIMGDGALYAWFGSTSYYISSVLEYSATRIILSVDGSSLTTGKSVIEVLERVP